MSIYIKGIGRRWWWFLIIVLLSLLTGNKFVAQQPLQYQARASIHLDQKPLVEALNSLTGLQIMTLPSPQDQVGTSTNMDQLLHLYPELNPLVIRRSLSTTMESSNQLLIIQFNDTRPDRAKTIVTLLAQKLCVALTNYLTTQTDFQKQLTQRTISLLRQQLTQQPPSDKSDPLPTQEQDLTQRQLAQQEYRLQQLTQFHPLFQQAYYLDEPVAVSPQPSADALSPLTSLLLLIGSSLGGGLLLVLALEYYSPYIRDEQDLQQIMEQSPILHYSFFQDALSHTITTLLTPHGIHRSGYTLLLTGISKQPFTIGRALGRGMAAHGYHTLLIDATFQKSPHNQELLRSDDLSASETPQPTIYPQLWLFSPASLPQLLRQISDLKQGFDTIVIATPSLLQTESRLLTTRVDCIWLLVQSRHDFRRDLLNIKNFQRRRHLKISCLLLTGKAPASGWLSFPR